MQYTISEISKMLADRADAVCQMLLPNGKRQGHEWSVGSVDGEAGNSMKVCLSGGKAGVWTDFANPGEGGDLIDLVMAVQGVDKGEAVKWGKEFLGIVDEKPTFYPKRKKYKLPARPKCHTPKRNSAVVEWFKSRGIGNDTLSAYKVAEDGTKAVFPYMHGDTLKFFKVRDTKDKKVMYTAKDAEPCLFGWQAVNKNDRSVIICEGEIDAMTFYQQGLPALSVPRGAGGGEKQNWLENEYDRLLDFDVIYLCMDNDPAGQEAQETLLKRIGNHRCLIPDLAGYKDANEYHMAGLDLHSAIENATSVDPEELCNAGQFYDEVMQLFETPLEEQGDRLPWSKTWNIVRLRRGEVSLWAGANGHGKTQMLGHIMTANGWQDVNTCVASLEMKAPKLLQRAYRQAAATNIVDRERGKRISDYFSGYLWVFNVRGTAKTDRILSNFEYAHRRYGCTQFIIDNLAKCGFDEDDYNGQKGFIDRLTDFAVQFDVHVHLVIHLRKMEAETKEPDKMDIKGTGAITDMVDNVFIVWRNKLKERAMQSGTNKDMEKFLHAPDSLLLCCKQRNGEFEGKIKLWFDRASLQFCEDEQKQTELYVE